MHENYSKSFIFYYSLAIQMSNYLYNLEIILRRHSGQNMKLNKLYFANQYQNKKIFFSKSL